MENAFGRELFFFLKIQSISGMTPQKQTTVAPSLFAKSDSEGVGVEVGGHVNRRCGRGGGARQRRRKKKRKKNKRRLRKHLTLTNNSPFWLGDPNNDSVTLEQVSSPPGVESRPADGLTARASLACDAHNVVPRVWNSFATAALL